MAVFYLLIKLAQAAGLFGLWLMIVILPGILRFLLHVSEARIYGLPIEAPGIEKFNWIGSAWSLMAALWISWSRLGPWLPPTLDLVSPER